MPLRIIGLIIESNSFTLGLTVATENSVNLCLTLAHTSTTTEPRAILASIRRRFLYASALVRCTLAASASPSFWLRTPPRLHSSSRRSSLLERSQIREKAYKDNLKKNEETISRQAGLQVTENIRKVLTNTNSWNVICCGKHHGEPSVDTSIDGAGKKWRHTHDCWDHWVLAVINPFTQVVYYFDSLGDRDINLGMKSIVECVIKMLNAQKGTKNRRKVKWEVVQFKGKEVYIQEAIDALRVEWVEVVADYIQDDVE